MKPVASVPPAEMADAAEWEKNRKPFIEPGERRGEADPVAWADYMLRRHYDAADLRALGRCLECGVPITLRQYHGVVVAEPCGHYRAHGQLGKIGKFLEGRRRKLTPERRASLLELVGGV